MTRKLRAALIAAAITTGLAFVPAPAAVAAPSTAPITTIPTTDGDILATAVLPYGTGTALAIGGNFAHVRSSGGALTAARNLAVLRIPDGVVLYAGNTDSYVRSLYAQGNRLYVGGSFGRIAGVPRFHIASLAVPGFALTPFNPVNGSSVYAITGVSGVIVFGGGGPLRAALPDATALRWEVPVTGGTIRALLPNCGITGSLYVGGLFEQVGPLAQHGLVRLDVSVGGTPVVNTVFRPVLKTDTGPGGTGYAGQEVLSLGCKLPDPQLMVGWGGATTNGIGAMTRDTGRWWWWRNTPGDLQALAVLPTTTIGGYHLNHGQTVPGDVGVHGEDGEKWFITEFSSSYGTATTWDPHLAGFQVSPDGGNGGVQALTVDTRQRVVFAGGAFTGTGNCTLAVWPCTAPITPRQSLMGWRY